MARVGRVQHNLPREISTFIGRDVECTSVARLLGTTPLLTLVGPGGVGKTRLALHVAGALAEDYADGVWLIELGRVFDPLGVPHAVTQAVDVREQAGRPPIETLSDALLRCIILSGRESGVGHQRRIEGTDGMSGPPPSRPASDLPDLGAPSFWKALLSVWSL